MITHIYFVRHAQPEHAWEEDRTICPMKYGKPNE